MNGRVFLDTNILIYFYSESEAEKQRIACQLLDENYCITSIQALNEASNVWSKKCKFNGQKINDYLDNIEFVCDEIVTIQRNTISNALSLKDKYGYSFYDCVMLASALENNCTTIATEDMNHGQIINNQLTIGNPFTL